jgi:hypothetical protein
MQLTTDPGMQQIAKVTVDVSELRKQGVPLNERSVTVLLEFGHTELVMTARLDKTGQQLKTTAEYK